jgi:hypothetical protein
MCFDAANTLFAGASPDSSDRAAFDAFARMSAGSWRCRSSCRSPGTGERSRGATSFAPTSTSGSRECPAPRAPPMSWAGYARRAHQPARRWGKRARDRDAAPVFRRVRDDHRERAEDKQPNRFIPHGGGPWDGHRRPATAGRAHDAGIRHAPPPRLHMGTTIGRSPADPRRARSPAQRWPPRPPHQTRGLTPASASPALRTQRPGGSLGRCGGEPLQPCSV